MSSSLDESSAPAVDDLKVRSEVERLRGRRIAMTTRMTLYYTLATLLILGAASTFLYWGLERSLLKTSSGFLDYKLQVLQGILQTRPLPIHGLTQEARDEAVLSQQSTTPFFVRVLRVRGSASSLITETPDLAADLPVSAFPSTQSANVVRRSWQDAKAHQWLLASWRIMDPDAAQGRATLPPPPPGSEPADWEIQAAVNIDHAHALLRAYRRDLSAVLAFGLLLAAASGAWVARRGLLPLVAITRVTERIGAQQLADRLRVSSWPTELTALATAYNRMLDRLQESFERLSQFSADMAHELRTPINNLVGEAQVALSQPRSAAEYERVLQSGLEEHARLTCMIDRMLFLARAEQTQPALQRQPLQASSQLQALVEFFDPLAQEQQVSLRSEGEAQLSADPLLLRRALSNLLSNALRYTPQGGSVTVQALQTSDGGGIVRVMDSGIGIAPEHLPKLGDRFYRVDPARSDSTAGAGLGLAIVKSIMFLHGGRLQIESTVGKGTVISLLFPAAIAMPSQPT
jgi:two-component system heavy metal sensor histidine kinase CusS